MLSNDTAQHLISFIAHDMQVEVHRHYCFQVIVSINSSFDCVINDISYKKKTGFIINQNIPHSCIAYQSSVLIYFIDAESYFGWQLKEMLARQPVIDIEALFTPEQRQLYMVKDSQRLTKPALQQLAHEIFNIILPTTKQPSLDFLDERISKAIAFIETKSHTNLQLKDVADLIALSPERTRHLFVQATGVPFSQFVLWKRLRQVIILTVRDRLSLTDAAIESGFADQAHFCRTFKRIFGISAKSLLKNSRSIQFLDPLT